VETYRGRQRIYKRREQLTVWVGAGVGALLAIASSHLLDGRPQLLIDAIATFAIGAGLALAFSRVKFEWFATSIDRLIEDNKVQKSTPFPNNLLNEDRLAEFLWSASLWTMALGWCLVLFSVLFTSPVAAAPCQVFAVQTAPSAATTIQHFVFPNFAKKDASLEHEDFPAQDKIKEVTSAWEEGREQGSEGIVVVIGSADRLPLGEKARIRFESNVGLARARAESVAEAISGLAKKYPLPPDRLVTLVSGPLNTPDTNEGQKTGFPEDRRVDVWMFWSHAPSNQLVSPASQQSNAVATEKYRVRARYALLGVTVLLAVALALALLPSNNAGPPQGSGTTQVKPLLRFRMYTKLVPTADRGIYLEVLNMDSSLSAMELKAFAKLAAPSQEGGVSIFFLPTSEVRPQNTTHVLSLTSLDGLLGQYFEHFDPSTAGIADAGEGGDFEAFSIELRCSYTASNAASPEIQVIHEQFLNVRRKI
jgi:hypothetical protein